jgi:hypothetical protein
MPSMQPLQPIDLRAVVESTRSTAGEMRCLTCATNKLRNPEDQFNMWRNPEFRKPLNYPHTDSLLIILRPNNYKAPWRDFVSYTSHLPMYSLNTAIGALHHPPRLLGVKFG